MKRGFSLVELLVVIGIIAVLASIMLVSIGGATESARAAKCVTNLRSLAQAANATEGAKAYSTEGGVTSLKAGHLYFENVGWISWLSEGKYHDVYNSTQGRWGSRSKQEPPLCPFYGTGKIEDDTYALEHGSIWEATGRNRDIYVCPSHQRNCTSAGMSPPLFSYVMNPSAFDEGVRSDRAVLFAEMHVEKGVKLTPGGGTTDVRYDSSLDYLASVNGKSYGNKKRASEPEQIGFLHKGSHGKKVAHVVFRDGHVEKLMEPNANSQLDVYQLTAALCKGFEISTQGANYQYIEEEKWTEK